MKRLLLFLVLSIICLTISAQTKTWIGPSGGYFSNAANWDPSGVPGSTNDVIIPTGSNVILDGANIKSFDIQGNSQVNMTNTLYFTNSSSIATNASFTWTTGYLQGPGTMNNNGNFTVPIGGNKYMTCSITNAGTINFPVAFTFRVIDDAVINNTTSGIIDFQSNAGIIPDGTGVHILNNAGIIKKSADTGAAGISLKLNNTGTIDVQIGTLNISGAENKALDGGVYNVTTGAVLAVTASSINLSGTLTGQIDGAMKWGSYGNSITVTNTATLDFDGNGFDWYQGHLNGDGVLINKGIFNFSSNANRYIDGATTLENQGVINFTVACNLRTQTNSTFYNAPSGVIDFQTDAVIDYGEAGSHIFNNAGLIKKTGGNTSSVSAKMINTGTISVETGTMVFGSQEKTFDGGVYNVPSGSILKASPSNLILSGTLTGQLDGEMKCGGYGTDITVTNAATLDFNGSGFNWSDGHLIGNGILTNKGTFNFSSNANRYLEGTTTLANQGTINFTVGCNLRVSNNTIIENLPTGIIDFQVDSYIDTEQDGIINNSGLITKTGGAGVATVRPTINNSGVIDVKSGTIRFERGILTNIEDGKVMGTAIIDLPPAANFTNDGIFAPGDSPGILTVVGDFKSSPTSKLEIELYGYNQGTEYDLLAIQGNAIMDGEIPVFLDFEANINDEFIVATANNITSCNLPATVTANYDGHLYTFDVICNQTNVTLKITNIVLGTEENNLSKISMYPNPSNGRFTINLGREYTDVTVQMTNMLGQVISSEKYASAKLIEKEINTSAGMYFIKVSTAKEGSNTLRIIKR